MFCRSCPAACLPPPLELPTDFFTEIFPGKNLRRRTARPRLHPPQPPPVCRCGHTPPPVPLTASAAGLLPVSRSAGLPPVLPTASAAGLHRRGPGWKFSGPAAAPKGFTRTVWLFFLGYIAPPIVPHPARFPGWKFRARKKPRQGSHPAGAFPFCVCFALLYLAPPIVPPNRQTARKTARKFVQKKFPGPP